MLTDASPPDQLKVNGPVECISTIIPTVVSSAFEAEYAAMFINGNTAAGIRNTLADLTQEMHLPLFTPCLPPVKLLYRFHEPVQRVMDCIPVK